MLYKPLSNNGQRLQRTGVQDFSRASLGRHVLPRSVKYYAWCDAAVNCCVICNCVFGAEARLPLRHTPRDDPKCCDEVARRLQKRGRIGCTNPDNVRRRNLGLPSSPSRRGPTPEKQPVVGGEEACGPVVGGERGVQGQRSPASGPVQKSAAPFAIGNAGVRNGRIMKDIHEGHALIQLSTQRQGPYGGR